MAEHALFREYSEGDDPQAPLQQASDCQRSCDARVRLRVTAVSSECCAWLPSSRIALQP
jgi:hypothetical protein